MGVAGAGVAVLLSVHQGALHASASVRRVGAVADHLLRKLKEDGYKGVRAEGLSTCDWVLVDAGDVVVHIFRAEVREFYGIEKMWAAEASPVPSGAPANVADRQLGAELSA